MTNSKLPFATCEQIEAICRKYPTPFHLYDERGIKENARRVNAAVIDMSTIKPIDRALICEWAEKTGAVVTAEEQNIIGGLGSAVSEVLALECPTPLEMVGVEDVFGESGTAAALVEKYGLTKEHIAEKAKKAIARK